MNNKTERHLFQVIDFGPGPEDTDHSIPFEGTEEECSKWIEEHQEKVGERFRFALQEVPQENDND